MSTSTVPGRPSIDMSYGVLSAPRAWALHLLSFALPVANAVFLLSGPHAWWSALAWIGVIVVLVMIDTRSPADHRQPSQKARGWVFDLQVYGLTALQLANHVWLGMMAAKLPIGSLADVGAVGANLLAVMVLSGTTAGYSGIVVAHEWIHRRNRFQFFLGRVLLASVLYEHFSTEHVRGHHPRVGTPDDPATARYGETLKEFVRRTIPAQFKSAWALEKERVARGPGGRMRAADWSRHRVLQGVVGELLLFGGYFAVFGPLAALFFFMQARTAVFLLETVNYIEHWGLARRHKKVLPEDSWDTDNWFTLHTLVGLSRHADHHAHASRPYYALRFFPDSAQMPKGYYGTIVMAIFRNQRYRELATEELRRRGLGPFAGEEQAPPAAGGAPPVLAEPVPSAS